jgi:hypothetical protein
MKIINVMKHGANLLVNGVEVFLAASGIEAICAEQSQPAGTIETEYGTIETMTSPVLGEVEGLPEPQQGVIFYCSGLAFRKAYLMGRRDVVCGDSGVSAIRWTKADVDAGLKNAVAGQVRYITKLIDRI